MKKHVLICGVALMLGACASDHVDFTIDNPTDRPIEIRIDGEAHTVAAQDEQSLTLIAGRHTLETATTGNLSFIVYANSPGALINPTLSTYVLVNEVYSTTAQTAKSFRPLEKTINLDGVDFTGPFEAKDDLFVDKKWAYGVHDDFPEHIVVSNDMQGNIKGKLFSKRDFVAYIEQGTEDEGYYDKHRAGSAPPKFKPTAPEMFASFNDPAIEVQAAKVRELYAHYLQSTDAAEQRALQKSWGPLVTELLEVYSPKSMKLGAEENKKYDHLVRKTGDMLGKSVWIETPVQ